MRIAIMMLAFFILSPYASLAGFTDFTDYSARKTSFENGEVFQSGDLFFRAIDQFPNPNSVLVFGRFQSLAPGTGVELLLPEGTWEVSLLYNEGSGVGMTINGIEPPFAAGKTPRFSQLDGISVAGVSVKTIATTHEPSGEEGTLLLRGPIDSLEFFGVELFFFEITVTVPEPSTLMLLLATAAFGAIRRRRNR